MQRLLLLAGVVLSLAGVSMRPVSAQTSADGTLRLTLSEARSLALRQNFDLLAARQQVAAARGELRQSRLLLNPLLDIETPRANTEGGGRAYEASLGQEIEWAGQRGLRIRAASTGVRGAEYSSRNAARRALADVSRAYYAAVAAIQRLAIAEEVFMLNDTLLSAVRTQAREGEISRMAAGLAEIEYGRARGRVLSARRELTSAEIELKQLVALAPAQRIRLDTAEEYTAPSLTALNLDSLIATALAQRPDHAADAERQQQLFTLQRLARREAIPNLVIGPRLERDEDTGQTRLGLILGVPLPIWNRNQGLIDQRRAETQRASFELQATELRVRSEVVEAHLAYLAASEEAGVYELQVRRPAHEAQRSLETAFRAGKIDLPSLLLTRNQLLEAELGYWDAWLAQREALTRLEAATAAWPDAQRNDNDDIRRQ